ncbi:MAG: fimbrillin family protein [Bacteroidales bacterium]|nr:fimbrillin family protein [Bacteroidales bacterium]
MKKFVNIAALLSLAILSLTGCNKEVEPTNDQNSESSHVVRFVSSFATSKTTMEIGNDNVVRYSWDSEDADTDDWFQVYEGTNPASVVDAKIDGASNKLLLDAIFDSALPSGEISFTGIMNGTVQSGQTSCNDEAHFYDRNSDVLLAKGTATRTQDDAEMIDDVEFSFSRIVAISKMTIKGLPVGAEVDNVTVSANADTPLVGTYDVLSSSWSTPESNKIDISCLETVENADEGIVVYFVSRPISNASITVDLTVDGVNYTKTTAPALTLTEGNVKGYTVRVVPSMSPEPIIVNAVIGDIADAKSWVSESKVLSFDLNDVISVSVTDGTNNGKYYATNKTWRVYQTDNALVSVSAKAGFAIQSVAVEYDSKNNGVILYGESKLESPATLSASNSSLVSFGVSQTESTDNKNGNVQIKSIKVTYVKADNPSYAITINNVTGGSIAASASSAKSGTVITLTPTASEGYRFSSWNVVNTNNGSSVEVSASNTFVMPASNVTVSAEFEEVIDDNTITISNLGYEFWGRNASFSGTTLDKVEATVNNVHIEYTRNGSNLYANINAIRFYKSNTITFTAPDGKLINSIVWGGSTFKNDVTTNANTCTSTTSGLSWSGRAKSVTFTRPDNAESYITLSSVVITLEDGEILLSSISIKTDPKKNYSVGDSFDPTGLEIRKTMDDGSKEDVAYGGHESEFTFNPSLGYKLKESDKTVSITYGGKTTVLNISVSSDVVLSAETKSVSSLPTGWSGVGGGNSYIQLINNSSYIQSPSFNCDKIVKVTLKARTYGGPNASQALITVKFGDTIIGTIAPKSTTLTDYTIESPVSVSGNGSVTIACLGASSSKGSGVSNVSITYSPAK